VQTVATKISSGSLLGNVVDESVHGWRPAGLAVKNVPGSVAERIVHRSYGACMLSMSQQIDTVLMLSVLPFCFLSVIRWLTCIDGGWLLMSAAYQQ